MAVGITGPDIWDRAMQLTDATNSASKPAPERHEGEPRHGRPIAIGDPDETLSDVQPLGGRHRWLSRQHQPPHPARGSLVDNRPYQGTADSTALRLRGHGEGPDFALIRTARDLAARMPCFQHDCSQHPVVLNGDQHLAVAISTEGTQSAGVVRLHSQKALSLICVDPQLTGRSHLTGIYRAHDHS
jgi:hypothetical protein